MCVCDCGREMRRAVSPAGCVPCSVAVAVAVAVALDMCWYAELATAGRNRLAVMSTPPRASQAMHRTTLPKPLCPVPSHLHLRLHLLRLLFP